MIDPTPFITGLVGTFSAYLTYRAAVVKAETDHTALPAKSDDATKGEQAAPVIKAAVQQHGDDKDRNALAQFEADPEDYQQVFETKLIRLAERNPTLAQQFQTLAQQANIVQPGGNVVNIDNTASNYGAQGTFNAPITFDNASRTKKPNS